MSARIDRSHTQAHSVLQYTSDANDFCVDFAGLSQRKRVERGQIATDKVRIRVVSSYDTSSFDTIPAIRKWPLQRWGAILR